MKRILFLCTGNSCRSQMAHGFAQAAFGTQMHIYSAGVETHGLNPRAVQVMQEVGIDITQHESTLVSTLSHLDFYRVLTVCDHARAQCPNLPGSVLTLHQSFEDPPALTRNLTDEEEILQVYRRVRDEIKIWVHRTLRSI
jgi:arsenate reductase (thioredoxin)